MGTSRYRKLHLPLGASTLAASIALLSAPYAQAQTGQAGAETQVSDVVVTGIRASLRNAADVKRGSVQVLDAISAEDIGDFPDKNLGEALGRVTGVQIDRSDGEGRGVSIRGANPELNRVEINGTTALSVNPGGGRQVDFRDLPVEFVNRLEVVKSQTADQTEGGLGGVVRVITRRPFDNGGRQYLAGSVQGVYSNLADAWDPKVALIGSRTFLDGRLGLLLGVQAEKRHLNNNNARTTGWLRRDPLLLPATNAIPGRETDINNDGTADWIPEIPRYSIDTRQTNRWALNNIIEFRPNDDLTLYFDGNYAYAKEQVRSSFMQLGAGAGLIDYANTTVGADNTVDHIELYSGVSGGTTFNMDLAYRNINGSLDREQYSTAFGGRWTPGNWVIDARLNYAAAEVQNDEKNSTATITNLARAVIDYTGSQRAPNISFPGIDPTTGQGVNRLVALFNPRTNTQEETVGKLDVEYRPEGNIWLTSIKGGIESRDLTMDSLLYSRSIQLDSPTAAAQTATTSSFVVPLATITNIVDTYSVVNQQPFFSTGDLGYTGGIRFWNNNGDEVYNATIAAAAAVGGPSTLDPYAAQFPLLPNTNANNNLGVYQNFLDTWSVSEKVTSLYWQGSFAFNTLPIPVSGTIGTRYIDTDTRSSGYNRVVTPIPASGATPAYNQVTFPLAERVGGYERWLPSANLRFDLIDNKLIGRLTGGKVMARPNPNQLALRQSLDSVGFTGSRGNPDLQPFEATQYDAALEYYFTRENFISLTAFEKKISNFIVNVASAEVIDGVNYSISRPVNGTERVTITGIELGMQYAFRSLPAPFDGFGVQANLTKQKDEGYQGKDLITGALLPFPGLSRESYNLSLYYENDKFSARTSYNYRSGWLISANGRGGLPEFNEEIGYLDASLTYNIDDRFTVFLEGTNLTDEVVVQNNAPQRRISNETFGTRYYIGVRAKF